MEATRRAFLALLPCLSRAADVLPSQTKKLRDPATEFEITRLTEPSFNSWLILPPARSISGRSNAFIYCSDRLGPVQAFRLDLKTGDSRQLTSANALDRSTVALLPDERAVCFFDGSALTIVSGARSRTVYQVERGWERRGPSTVTEDGNHALFVEQNTDGRRRMRMVALGRGSAATVVETEDDITFIRPRPRRASILYGRDSSLSLVEFTGANDRRLKIAEGKPAQALWLAGGKTFTYLRVPPDAKQLHELREHTPDTSEDVRLAATSQFITFTRNSDASVFAGVSQNKASPYILLLLRVARRELTLAEHRATSPADVTVLFTPNSQRLLWSTNREGKTAIYSLPVEKFVEQTEEDENYGM